MFMSPSAPNLFRLAFRFQHSLLDISMEGLAGACRCKCLQLPSVKSKGPPESCSFQALSLKDFQQCAGAVACKRSQALGLVPPRTCGGLQVLAPAIPRP
eukprot:1160346-Pelagomonas_calceolata.AAC.10